MKSFLTALQVEDSAKLAILRRFLIRWKHITLARKMDRDSLLIEAFSAWRAALKEACSVRDACHVLAHKQIKKRASKLFAAWKETSHWKCWSRQAVRLPSPLSKIRCRKDHQIAIQGEDYVSRRQIVIMGMHCTIFITNSGKIFCKPAEPAFENKQQMPY